MSYTVCHFGLKDPRKAYEVSLSLSRHFPQPEECITGIHELLMNALEHGNLEIGFEEKAELIRCGKWCNEIIRRMHRPEYRGREANVKLICSNKECRLVISDSGKGFRWKEQLNYFACADRPNGRGLYIVLNSKFDEVIFNSAGNEVTCIAKYA